VPVTKTTDPPMCFPENVLADNSGESCWFAIHTKPRQEKALAWNLIQIGIGYYLPLSKQRQRSKNRSRFSVIPLFTSYLFIKCNSSQRLETYKTNRIIRAIEVVDQDLFRRELNAVHTVLSNRDVTTSNCDFKKGKKVRIVEGPLSGVEGLVLQRKNKKELVVQVASIHQALRVDIEFDKVELL
jgi:transcriptional antiterminator RfaH